MITAVKMIVDDDHRIAVKTQRAPADIIISPMPVNPGRPPMDGGNPIPAESKPPVPSSVMIDTPTPRVG
jgi:hypothetical protein